MTSTTQDNESKWVYRNRYNQVSALKPRSYVAIVAGVFLCIFLLVLFVEVISGFQSVPVDKVGLHYTGGPIEGQKFSGIYNPGTGKRFIGLADKMVLLPVTQRDYIVSLDPDQGDKKKPDSIKAPARGGVEMQFEIAAYFKLNTSPQVVRKFYENICVKFDCTSTKGWDLMLNNNFRKPIEQAIQEQVRQHTVAELYAGDGDVGADPSNPAKPVITRIQEEIAKQLKLNINEVLGDNYFCGPTFNRSTPNVCPDFQFQIISATPTSDAVRSSFSQNAASQQKVITAKNNANAQVAEAEGKRRSQEALQGLYKDPAYIAYLRAQAMQTCAVNSRCTMVTGTDDVNINTGAP